ncbi:hypothetical protein KY290_021614 [Solanum tuberosum]|uniref:Uncharacterized protein n=1 Tax=Solanum tuberosum TaxID=4113 RepID=A0ABQ7V440_SOLTU|nr:hypothetical protein KY290_021614 [Solanum tuberosum]
MNMAKNLVQHKRTNHIDMRHHFLRDNVEKQNVMMKFYKTEDQLADIFTKPLSKDCLIKTGYGWGCTRSPDSMTNESPSTPVCGVGETDESITLLIEVVASHVLPYEEILPCSPTLVLSCDKSQNSEAQSVAKPVDEPSNEDVEVASRGVSSTMYKQFFEGDLSEGRGPETNILAAGAKLVAAQSLTSLRGDVQPTFSESDDRSQEQVPLSIEPIFDQTPKSFNVETEEEEEEPLLRWNRTGVRGANTLTVGVLDLETTNNDPEVDHITESTKTEKERQRKGKGKMVVSHSKGEKMIWNKE